MTCSVPGRMRGSKSRIAWRIARSSSVDVERRRRLARQRRQPEVDDRAPGVRAPRDRSASASSRVALNSQARSRSTAWRRRLFDITRCSRGSSFLSGSSSVSRSSSAGCSRSCGVQLQPCCRPAADARLAAPRRCTIVRTSISGMLAGVGREDALAEPVIDVRARPRSQTRLARQRDQRRRPTASEPG